MSATSAGTWSACATGRCGAGPPSGAPTAVGRGWDRSRQHRRRQLHDLGRRPVVDGQLAGARRPAGAGEGLGPRAMAAGTPAWPRSPTIVIDAVGQRRASMPPLHRLTVLRLVDDEVAERSGAPSSSSSVSERFLPLGEALRQRAAHLGVEVAGLQRDVVDGLLDHPAAFSGELAAWRRRARGAEPDRAARRLVQERQVGVGPADGATLAAAPQQPVLAPLVEETLRGEAQQGGGAEEVVEQPLGGQQGPHARRRDPHLGHAGDRREELLLLLLQRHAAALGALGVDVGPQLGSLGHRRSMVGAARCGAPSSTRRYCGRAPDGCRTTIGRRALWVPRRWRTCSMIRRSSPRDSRSVVAVDGDDQVVGQRSLPVATALARSGAIRASPLIRRRPASSSRVAPRPRVERRRAWRAPPRSRRARAARARCSAGTRVGADDQHAARAPAARGGCRGGRRPGAGPPRSSRCRVRLRRPGCPAAAARMIRSCSAWMVATMSVIRPVRARSRAASSAPSPTRSRAARRRAAEVEHLVVEVDDGAAPGQQVAAPHDAHRVAARWPGRTARPPAPASR